MWSLTRTTSWKKISNSSSRDWTSWTRCIRIEIIQPFRLHKTRLNGITNSCKFMTKMSSRIEFWKINFSEAWSKTLDGHPKSSNFWIVGLSTTYLTNLVTTATTANAWNTKFKKYYKNNNNKKNWGRRRSKPTCQRKKLKPLHPQWPEWRLSISSFKSLISLFWLHWRQLIQLIHWLLVRLKNLAKK